MPNRESEASTQPTKSRAPQHDSESRPQGTSSAPAAPQLDCNPPYFYDERGVKKYKPDCL